MNNELFEDYKKQYEAMHDKGHFPGKSLKSEYVEIIKSLVEKTYSKTALDFGCGKAKNYKTDPPINHFFGIKSENMKFYDIGFKEYEVLPEGQFDGIICTDVLEHVPEPLLDDTLEKIFTKSKKFVFLTVSCGLAMKSLPNGENAHVTVKKPEWWNNKFKKYYTSKKIVHVQYLVPKDPKYNILNL